jgi:hypothetical protein
MTGRSAQRPRLPRAFYLVAAACAVVVVLIAALLYGAAPSPRGALASNGGSGPSPTSVEVVGYDLVISYWTANHSDTSYLDSPECDRCPANVTPSGTWSASLGLTNADSGRAHSITNLTIGPPFRVLLVAPSLPYNLAPGTSVVLDVQLQVPSTPGSFFLVGSIGTS